MKTIITFLFCLPLFINAQIEVSDTVESKTIIIGKVKRAGITYSELNYTVTGKDTVYRLMYKNAEYEILSDRQFLYFNNENNTLETLYKILKSFFSDDHKKDLDYKISFKLGQDFVAAKNSRTSVFVSTTKGYFYLSNKEIDNLFGK